MVHAAEVAPVRMLGALARQGPGGASHRSDRCRRQLARVDRRTGHEAAAARDATQRNLPIQRLVVKAAAP